jgi:predicted kinase
MKNNAQTLHDRLEYLAKSTGLSEAELVAQALEEGMKEIYRRSVAAAYQSGELSRAQALAKLGQDVVADIDYAREAVSRDVKWGVKGA